MESLSATLSRTDVPIHADAVRAARNPEPRRTRLEKPVQRTRYNGKIDDDIRQVAHATDFDVTGSGTAVQEAVSVVKNHTDDLEAKGSIGLSSSAIASPVNNDDKSGGK